jgi:phage baseplate assembly protein W
MSIYRGFSTLDYDRGTSEHGVYPSINVRGLHSAVTVLHKLPYSEGSNTFSLIDIALVERNILNHIFTPKRSRLMMPNFGTNLHKMIFEPLDAITIDTLYDEIRTVVNFDPRVKLKNLTIVPDYNVNSVVINLDLYYVELQVTKELSLNILFNQ